MTALLSLLLGVFVGVFWVRWTGDYFRRNYGPKWGLILCVFVAVVLYEVLWSAIYFGVLG